MSTRTQIPRREAFLAQFSPGESARVRTGADRLAAAHHSWDLAEPRRQAGPSQEQTPLRLGLTMDEMVELERDGPDSPPLRTLASYLAPLSGQLSLTATFPDGHRTWTVPPYA